MKNVKIYNSFKDRFGKEYRFDNYLSFASFWFGISLRLAKDMFPEYKKLQNCAANSKEARVAFTTEVQLRASL